MAAYRDYLSALAAAQQRGELEDPQLQQVAADQALVTAQARVQTLQDEGEASQGDYAAAITSTDVADGRSSATVKSCTRLTRITDQQSGQEVQRSGDRFAGTAELTKQDDFWIVAKFNFGDRCVPQELAEEIKADYRAASQAFDQAAAHPDNDSYLRQLAQHEVDPQLSASREFVRGLRRTNRAVQGSARLNPEVVEVRDHDTVALLQDCQQIRVAGTKGVHEVNLVSGEVVTEADVGERSLWEARLIYQDGRWMIQELELEQEDSSCGE